MKKYIGIAILIFAAYMILGAVIPFLFQPAVQEETKAAVKEAGFYGDTVSEERACILADNGEALEERIRLISQAEERIILSTFEFRTDESGKDMLAALLAAAQRGVSVQVLADGISGMTNMTGNKYFRALAAAETAQIRIYNPIVLYKPWRLMGRLHDKYLIVDERTYVLGGRNTYDYFLGDHDGYKNYDWDVLVYHEGQGTGPSMNQLIGYFDSVWDMPLCKDYHENEKEAQKAPVIRAAEELRERYAAMQETHPAWFEDCDYREKTRPVRHMELVTNPTSCYAKEPVVFYTITQLMENAESQVRFHTPYIICNDWMLERLESVCQNVPGVFMMTNSVANNGNPFGAMDYQKNRGKILDAGVGILEYDGGVSYHGKCFLIDDRLSGIGSFNWDMRSAYIDTEMMLVIDSEELAADLKAGMQEYEKKALLVLDENTSVAPEGMLPQKLTFQRKARIVLLRLTGFWARFLM